MKIVRLFLIWEAFFEEKKLFPITDVVEEKEEKIPTARDIKKVEYISYAHLNTISFFSFEFRSSSTNMQKYFYN